MPHPLVDEELALLARVNEALAREPSRARPSENTIVKELARLREQLLSGRGADDHAALSSEIRRQSAILQQIREARAVPGVVRSSPYFGHLRLREGRRQWDICLGKATFVEGDVSIVDWRNAPISKVFYRYRQGDEFDEVIAGRPRNGVVAARRNVVIREARLRRVEAPEGDFQPRPDSPTEWERRDREPPRLAGGGGSALEHHRPGEAGAHRLGNSEPGLQRADKHLPDIAGLIDPEQFELITRPSSGLVVIRGTAGSGKTTVALHRIAYLAFEDESIDSGQTLVIVFSPALRDYVAHVLPALGVSQVRVCTFREWSGELRRKLFPMLPTEVRDDAPTIVQRLKQHPVMLEALAAQVHRVSGPPTARQVIDDWGSVLCQPDLLEEILARVSPGAFDPSDLERACEWNRRRHEQTVEYLEGEPESESHLDPADDALLLRAWQLRVGAIRGRKGRPLRFRHIAIDEVQDFSPLEVRVLLDCLDAERSLTLAGDTQQHVLQQAGFTSWSDFFRHLGLDGTEVNTLRVSYRSTRQIVDLGLSVLGPLQEDDEPPLTTRSGPPVEFFRFTDHGACIAFLAPTLTALEGEEPLASVVLLTPNSEISNLYDKALRDAEVPRVQRIRDQRYSFAPGVEITEIDQVKGLEFDYVILIEVSTTNYPDSPAARRLLHVGATRAIHQLWLTSVATPSALIRGHSA
jgi:DNA helicase-2/ATP-dependent DNA helicase PcrA